MVQIHVADPATDGTRTVTATGPQLVRTLPNVVAGALADLIDGRLIDQGYWRTSPWERAGKKEVQARVIDVGVAATRVAEQWLAGPLPHQEANEK